MADSQTPMRVGTYDSRAIAVAYVRSDFGRQAIDNLMAERDKAKAAGDEKRVKEVEARGRARQERLHQQGFGTASVMEMLDRIKAEIPGVAREAGVALIVSKWEVVYRDPSVEYVDVTVALVKKFGADPKMLKMIEDLMQHEPMPIEALSGHID
jgi:hypothetical protein